MKLSIPLAVLIALSMTACGTLEVGLERTPAPTLVAATQPVATPKATRENTQAVSPALASTVVATQPVALPEATRENPQAVSPALASTPEPAAASDLQKVVAWPGFVVSLPAGSNYDDYLMLLPKGAREVGVVGNTPEIENQVVALRDNLQEVSHFWGTLQCPADDYKGCQLKVEKVRSATNLYAPDPVEGWEGTLGCGQPVNSASPDTCSATTFTLAGKFPVVFDTWVLEPDIQNKMAELQGTGALVRLWGEVTAGIPVFNGVQIKVNRIEVEK